MSGSGPVLVDDSAPGSVLAVYAHPDDPEVSCAGTIARWVRAGAVARLVLVHRGDKGSNDPGMDPDALAARRAAETAEAAAVVGLASVEHLGLPDGESENDLELRRRQVELVRRHRPEVLIAPDPTALFFGDGYVNHRDHRVCGEAVLDAAAAAAGPLYFPGVGGEAWAVRAIYLSGTLAPDTWVDIGAVLERKVRALACHRSQLGGAGEFVHELVELRARDAGRRVGLGAAETFRVLRPGG